MFENIKASIQGFGSFSDKDLQEIINRLKILSVEKDALLVSEGQICREFYFINRGSFRHYTVLENGAEAVLNLYVENEWMFDYKSFMAQQPTNKLPAGCRRQRSI